MIKLFHEFSINKHIWSNLTFVKLLVELLKFTQNLTWQDTIKQLKVESLAQSLNSYICVTLEFEL